MRAVLALAAKDVRLLVRDKGTFVFAFFWPLLMAVMFGLMFSGDGGSSALPVAVVDEDGSPSSKALAEVLEKGDEVEVLRVASRDEAADLVRRGKRSASIVLPKGFGDAVAKGFLGPTPRIVVASDPSRRAETAMLRGVLIGRVLDARASAMAGTPGAVQLPPPVEFESMDVARVRRGPSNAFSYTFAQGIVWAIIGAAAAFAQSLVAERTRGTLVRLVMSPFSRTNVLAGKGLACFATTTAVSVLLIAIGVLVFGVRPTSVPVLATAILAASLGFVGIMMLIASLGKTEASAAGMAWGIFLVMAMLGGGMVPLFAMPAWMKTVSDASPVKWAILSLEGGLWRDFSFGELALPCGILLAIGVAGFAFGVRSFRWSDR
jgi:ABC-2 type transport system permease protein